MILEDVQSRPDQRGLQLDRVGVSGLRHPITVWDRSEGKQETVGTIAMSVTLPAQYKGAHMSRFLEVLDLYGGEFTYTTIPTIVADIQQRLGTPAAQLVVDFPYFVRRHAPVSGASALMSYECRFEASSYGEDVGFALRVQIPVTSVCPCSKAISDYGAHNQRGIVTIEVTPNRGPDGDLEMVWIEELIEIGEASASSPLYPLLKRRDERHVTMAGYDKPVFVEDMVRDVASQLRGDLRIQRFYVEAVNDESIHNHAAFARLASPTADE